MRKNDVAGTFITSILVPGEWATYSNITTIAKIGRTNLATNPAPVTDFPYSGRKLILKHLIKHSKYNFLFIFKLKYLVKVIYNKYQINKLVNFKLRKTSPAFFFEKHHLRSM